MSEQALGASQWRAIRLFLSSITDQELDDVRGYLAKELAARQECEDSITRLLFSSLTPLDLKTASQLLQTEEAAARSGALPHARRNSQDEAASSAMLNRQSVSKKKRAECLHTRPVEIESTLRLALDRVH
jgi:hypothetical protein